MLLQLAYITSSTISHNFTQQMKELGTFSPLGCCWQAKLPPPTDEKLVSVKGTLEGAVPGEWSCVHGVVVAT